MGTFQAFIWAVGISWFGNEAVTKEMIFLIVTLANSLLFLVTFLIWQSDTNGPLGHPPPPLTFVLIGELEIPACQAYDYCVVKHPTHDMFAYRDVYDGFHVAKFDGTILESMPTPDPQGVTGMLLAFGQSVSGDNLLMISSRDEYAETQITPYSGGIALMAPNSFPGASARLMYMGSDGDSYYWFFVTDDDGVAYVMALYRFVTDWEYLGSVNFTDEGYHFTGVAAAYSDVLVDNQRLYVVSGKQETPDAGFASNVVFIGVNAESPLVMLKLEDGESSVAEDAKFGEALAVSGDGLTIAVGGPGAGVTWVYRAVAGLGSWDLEATLTGTDEMGEAIYSQGYSVSLSYDGNVLAVGAPEHGSVYVEGNERPRGAVLVFSRNSNGVWSQEQAPLVIDSPYPLFGSNVSLSRTGSELIAVSRGMPGSPGMLFHFEKA